jgi:hypothetical protein
LSISAIWSFSTVSNLATILSFFFHVELPDIECLDCVELLHRLEHFELLLRDEMQRPGTKTFWK